MAPPGKFKYDPIQLINCVKERPCLWDKTLENYKDRIERKNAWEEIFNILEDQYEELSWEDKRITGELIQNKWTNVRDTFVKTLKSRFGKPKRKYLLYEHLKFLTKVVPEEEICADYNEDHDQQDSIQDTSVSFLKQEDEEASTSYEPPKKSKRKNRRQDYAPKKSKKINERKKSNDSDYETYDTGNDSLNFLEVDSKVESDPRLMNEDEAFFASLLPTIVRYNESERLEFRMEVLKVMKKIMDKRTWSGDDN